MNIGHVWKITVILNAREKRILDRISKRELREPSQQATYFVRLALQQDEEVERCLEIGEIAPKPPELNATVTVDNSSRIV